MAIKRVQHLRGDKANLAGTPLKDGELFLDTTGHKAMMGDTGEAAGNFTLARDDELSALTTRVDDAETDIDNIQADYAKTTGGNTITANAVAVSDASGKLKGLTGAQYQIPSFDANGVPTIVDDTFCFNKSAAFTMPTNTNSPATVAIANLPANCDPFMIVPEYNEWDKQPRNFNRVRAVISNAGSLTVHHVGALDTTVPCRIYWTEKSYG